MSTKERIWLSPPHMSGLEIEYVKKAFDENWIVPMGPNVNMFEQEMKTYLDEEVYPVALSSGTAAIHIALRLLGLEEGEEVFCSSATFVASVNPVLYEKAKPVFIDSEKDTWNICPKSLQKAIDTYISQKKTLPRILIAVDLFGTSVNYEEIVKICDKYEIKIIEDSAEALGANFKGRKCGLFGEFGIFSFNGNKLITTSGGGMLITKSKEHAEKALFLATQARDDADYYLHSEIGYNYRMSNICAGIGIGQMQVVDDRVDAKRRIYNHYKKELESCTPLRFHTDNDGCKSSRWLSVAIIDKSSNKTPKELISFLKEENIEARHIWKPLHSQPLFENAAMFSVEEEIVAEDIFNRGICLPSGTALRDDQLDKICKLIKDFFS